MSVSEEISEKYNMRSDDPSPWRKLFQVTAKVAVFAVLVWSLPSLAGKNGEITWVSIPAGTFQMGSNSGDSDELPVHGVTLSAFEMSAIEVTVAQYRICVDAGECRAPQGNYNFSSNYDEHPVVNVTWDDARTFAAWAGGRLPTEAEWEYAARGGAGYTYAGSNTPANVGWVRGNSGGRSHEAAGLPANGYGLYDMSGNVFEWVSDWYATDYYSRSPSSNPENRASASDRVIRSGSWGGAESNARVASRYNLAHNASSTRVGFRIAR
jgi:formylglycine-generating enzyme required for sulfatase activity